MYQLNTVTLFGVVVILGLVGGTLAKKTRFLPKISGYIFIGFLLGPSVLNLMNHQILTSTRFFVDIPLGIILFELGRHLDFAWLRHDVSLLQLGLTEALLSFSFAYILLHYGIGLDWIPSVMAGCFAMATAPSVVLMIANDTSSVGPVTRRTLLLTSINNFLALFLFTLFLPLTETPRINTETWMYSSGYMMLGSLGLALTMFVVLRLLATLIGKNRESQFIAFVGSLTLTIGLAHLLKLPTALALFMLGTATRNFDSKHNLMEINFGTSARLFFILLFVVTGTYLKIDAIRAAAFTAIVFILVRVIAKYIAICLFGKKCRLTKQQMIAIGLALTPMAGLAMNMSNVLEDFSPDINHQISAIIAATVAILEIIGPIATQYAFVSSKETTPEPFE